MGTTTRTDIVLEGNDVILTRFFDAPRRLVYKAWTDPAQMKAWFGPRFFTESECEMDLRPGGAWRIAMGSPAGDRYPLSGTYLEIVEAERLVMSVSVKDHPEAWHQMVRDHKPAGADPRHGDMVWTVTFEERDGGTLLTIRDHFEQLEDRDAHVKMGMNGGWNESFERLQELVSKLD